MPIPLKKARFEVDITQGYADVILHQVYENDSDKALEVLFAMPISLGFSLNSIEVDFTLEDGTKKTLVTKCEERVKAQAQYSDAVASGKTAVLSTLPPTPFTKQMLRVMLGNFP